jgi:hypothetical protein
MIDQRSVPRIDVRSMPWNTLVQGGITNDVPVIYRARVIDAIQESGKFGRPAQQDAIGAERHVDIIDGLMAPAKHPRRIRQSR